MLSIVKNIDRTNEPEWNNYLSKKNTTTFADDPRWLELMDKHYRFPQYRSVVLNNGNVQGSLALTMTKHPLLGRYLATAPFANYGGLHFDDKQSLEGLIDLAEKISFDENVKYVILRHAQKNINLPKGWKKSNIYATYVIPLKKDPNVILRNSIKKNARRDVNKANRGGYKIKFDSFALLDDFWDIITRSMKELGSPYHSKNYIIKLLEIWGDDAKIGIAYTNEGNPFGCCLLMFHKDTAILLHANILNKYKIRAMCAGEFLYWSVISECCKRGFSQLDLGRSLIGSGNERFKMKWKPKVYPLHYWYYLNKDISIPNLNQSNPRYKIPRHIWGKLPLFIHRKIGPHLISGIL